ncbi:2-hydroxyisoflavanone dehydratase [Cajanus cajan]|uniref:Gibberellin receptor GID1L1 n=1 Tax=Cajanus cajan TaxID=3821 RepID=A0A151TJX9_CAJCA|nr:2-hydroxyisoflavanone dehydratase [Cajanus cajan]KYP67362.1 putative gibberellin receptor GID1L1 [Cajanus cajan]
MSSTCSASTKEITLEIPSLVRVYNDGTVERLQGSPFVASTLEDPTTGVSSKDVVISNNPPISARMYLPNKNVLNHNKVPILVYFHGGAFFFESAFSEQHQNYVNMLVSVTRVIVVSVEYRLAPETPLPAAYDDCWDALKWVANKSDTWLLKHGDFNRVFIGGDSAGANIVHNVGMRVGVEVLPRGVKVFGAIVSHPYFFGSKPIGCEAVCGHEESVAYRIWEFVCPNGPGGLDNPLINPLGSEAASLDGLGCSKLLVCTAQRDMLRERAVSYYEAVKKSRWQGEAELFEVESEQHVFHVHNPHTVNAHKMLQRFADFLLRYN